MFQPLHHPSYPVTSFYHKALGKADVEKLPGKPVPKVPRHENPWQDAQNTEQGSIAAPLSFQVLISQKKDMVYLTIDFCNVAVDLTNGLVEASLHVVDGAVGGG